MSKNQQKKAKKSATQKDKDMEHVATSSAHLSHDTLSELHGRPPDDPDPDAEESKIHSNLEMKALKDEVYTAIDTKLASANANLMANLNYTLQTSLSLQMDTVMAAIGILTKKIDRQAITVTNTDPPGGSSGTSSSSHTSTTTSESGYEFKSVPSGVNTGHISMGHTNMMDTSNIGSPDTMFQTPVTARTTMPTVATRGTGTNITSSISDTSNSSLDSTVPMPITAIRMKHATINNSFMGTINTTNATTGGTTRDPSVLDATVAVQVMKSMATGTGNPSATNGGIPVYQAGPVPGSYTPSTQPTGISATVPVSNKLQLTTNDNSKTFTIKEEYRGMSPSLDCKFKLPGKDISPWLPAVGLLEDNSMFNNYLDKLQYICSSSLKYGSMLRYRYDKSWKIFYNGNKKYHDNPDKIQSGFLLHTHLLSGWLYESIPEPLARAIKNKLKREIPHLGTLLNFNPDVIEATPIHYDDPFRILQEITNVYRKKNPLAIAEYKKRLRELKMDPNLDPEVYINDYDDIINEALSVVPGFREPTEEEMYGDYYIQWPNTPEHAAVYSQLEREARKRGTKITVKELQEELKVLYELKNSRSVSQRSLVQAGKHASTYRDMYPSRSSQKAMANATSESSYGEDDNNHQQRGDYDSASANATSHMATRSPKYNSRRRSRDNNQRSHSPHSQSNPRDRRGSQSPHRGTGPSYTGNNNRLYNKSPDEISQRQRNQEGTQSTGSSSQSTWVIGDTSESDDEEEDTTTPTTYRSAYITVASRTDPSLSSDHLSVMSTGRADVVRILDENHIAIDHCTDLSITPRADLLTNIKDLKRPIWVTTIGGIAKYKVTKQGILSLADGRLKINNCKLLPGAPYSILCGSDLTRAGLSSVYLDSGCHIIATETLKNPLPTGTTLDKYISTNSYVVFPTKGRMCVLPLTTPPQEDPSTNISWSARGRNMIPKKADKNTIRLPSGDTISSVPSVSFGEEKRHVSSSSSKPRKITTRSKSPRGSQSNTHSGIISVQDNGTVPLVVPKTPLSLKPRSLNHIMEDNGDSGAHYITVEEDQKRNEEDKILSNKRPTAQIMQEAQDRLKGRVPSTSAIRSTPVVMSANAATRSFTMHSPDSPAAPIRSSTMQPLHGYDTDTDAVTVQDHQQYTSDCETGDIIDSDTYDHLNGHGFSEEM